MTWKLVGYGDVNADGSSDVVWFNQSTSEVAAWLTDGSLVTTPSGTYFNITGTTSLTTGCSFVACGDTKVVEADDFNGDGNLDLLSYDPDSGTLSVWLFNSSQGLIGTTTLPWTCGGGCSTGWTFIGLSDVNADQTPDLMWNEPSTGQIGYWLVADEGGSVTGSGLLQTLTAPHTPILGTTLSYGQILY